MPRRIVLILLECLVALILAFSAALLWASSYIDTQEFRDLFTSTLEDVLGRKVTLVGDMSIAIWPTLALEASGLDIGEDPEFGGEPAATFDQVSIKVRVIPLFSRQVEVDSVVINGLRTAVILDSEGRLSWESVGAGGDTPSSEPPSLHDWELSVHSMEVMNADVVLEDRKAGTEYRLSGIALRTGAIRFGEDVPFSVSTEFSWADQGIESSFELQGLVRYGQENRDLVFSETTAQGTVSGDFLPKGEPPGQFAAKVRFDLQQHTLELDDLEARFFGLRADGNLTGGDLSKELTVTGHVTVHPFSPEALITRHHPQFDFKGISGLKSSAFASFVKVTEQGMTFDNLVLTLDDITVRGRMAFTGYADPVFDFNLRGNTIDFDRYLPLFQTGTPFVWGDFHLPFFRAFRGKGEARADGFKILDTLVSDIRVNVDATDAGINLDAGAIRKGMASLGGRMTVKIGSTGKEGVPTLALEGALDAESQRDGFAFLQADTLSIGGSGVLRFEGKVRSMKCPPEERSIHVLRNLDGKALLTLGEGVARLKGDSDQPQELRYTKADLTVKVAPAAGSTDTTWNCAMEASLQTKGGVRFETVSLNANGPFSSGIDDVRFASPGMVVSGHVVSSLLPNEAKRVTVNSVIGFDSVAREVKVTDGEVRVLETPIGGSARITGIGKQVQATGVLKVAQADPKRIIYLLTGKAIATRDIEALKAASVETQFTADEEGFTLSNFQGALDGMPVRGHIVGTGYKQPMLAFSLAGGSLDVDRYRPPKKIPTLEERRQNKEPQSEPVDLPLKFLRFLRLNGKATLQEFTLAAIRAESLTGFIKADEGVIRLSDITGTLHQGRLKADWTGEAGPRELSTRLVLSVDNMQAGPFMDEIAKREYVRGETDIKFDLSSRGATDDDIVADLSGKLSGRVVNGSFKFTDWDAPRQTVSSARRQQIGQTEQSRTEARTVFQRAVADFTVRKGVFKMDKFRLEAPPVLQSYGEGQFSLPANRIDLSIRNDFVAVPSVTLRMTGKLSDPKVDIPTGKIVNDTVFNVLSLPKKSFEFLRDLF